MTSTLVTSGKVWKYIFSVWSWEERCCLINVIFVLAISFKNFLFEWSLWRCVGTEQWSWTLHKTSSAYPPYNVAVDRQKKYQTCKASMHSASRGQHLYFVAMQLHMKFENLMLKRVKALMYTSSWFIYVLIYFLLFWTAMQSLVCLDELSYHRPRGALETQLLASCACLFNETSCNCFDW